MKAVIYARYSSSGQREESIEGQIRDCRAYAALHEIDIVGEYTDKAITGRTDRRPDFQRMIADSAKKQFDAVICWKIDRFARDRYDAATYKAKLKKNGVRLLYAKETIPDGPEGIILESVMEGYAEYYSKNLSQNVQRGNYDSALECKALGHQLIGYVIGKDGKYEIDPVQAPVVKRIFEEYAQGRSTTEICETLNREGYKTRRGGKFTKNGLHTILSNIKYTGVYLYKDLLYIEGGMPAIIDKELFERVQRIMKDHATAPKKKDLSDKFLLTTKLFCGHCKSPMIGDSGTSKTGAKHYYYTCSKRKRGGGCDKKSVRKADIEDRIVDEIHALIMTDGFIEQVADKVMEYQDSTEDTSRMAELESHRRTVETALENMMKAIEQGIITPRTKSRVDELEAELSDIDASISMEHIASKKIPRDAIIYFLSSFKSGDVDDYAYRERLIDTFLNAVYLYDDGRMVIALNYKDGNETASIETAVDAMESGVEVRLESVMARHHLHTDTACRFFFFYVAHFCRTEYN